MRIAIVASDYAPTVGGVQTAVRNIAHNAAAMGHAVTIISALNPGAETDELVDGVPVHRVPWGRRPMWTLPLRAIRTLARMARVLYDFKPDIVYVHFLSINAMYVLLLHYVMRFGLVASARGNDIQGIPIRSRGQRWMLGHLFQRANAILFCSSYVQHDAAVFLKKTSPEAFVGVVGDGFDAAEFQGVEPFRYPAPYLLAAGRLVHKKGFDFLIEAFGEISAEFPHLHLMIAGDGDERKALEDLVKARRMEERIHLLGFADREKTISLFLGCEFFVLSSRIEPFGIVVVEAMAARKAVLATRSGGVIDLVQPGINGCLVEPTAEALAEGMREMLSRPEETRAMGQRAAETIRQWTWAGVTEQFVRVFERVMDTKA